ncbi:HsdM family class I SAM-dependent methyltransferase [Micromonospora coerulea]|uniref:HsdM family class I SAM-dependent methyltransferase n=1 Tax=Micromonospora coerulea TaxID=47856 RepID=UPI00190785BA|nr:N-6 DNA methylase [Micromonospora veneta]
MSTVLPEGVSYVLEELGYAQSEGLVSADNVTPGARGYIWRDLHEKVKLDAAFFYDGVPLVGFAAADSSNDLRDLRKRLWNYGRVPLLIASSSGNSVEVYNAVSNPQDPGNPFSAPLAEAASGTRARSVLHAFARKQVEAGDFARDNLRSYRDTRRVEQGLLRNLRHLRQQRGQGSPARSAAIDALIGGCLTSRYLEDRGVLDARHLLELVGVRDLQTALEEGTATALQLFEGLAQRFNGDVFGVMPNAISNLENADLRAVASLLRGDDLLTGQGSLWPYDFSIVPADLVSSVYEQLLETRRATEATHYTPRFLVDVVLDEVIPHESDSEPRVIDLACGSGAFITEAYRRLVYRRVSSGQELTYQDLKELLQQRIFGIDINDAAARVTVFGLYLSLLEEIDPPTIWETAVLPQLIGRNILVSDAFAGHALSHESFDVVVSNPPWSSSLTPAARRYLHERELPVGDNQSAQAFMWLAADMLKPGGRLGLVMPAKGMLHNRSRPNVAFRAAIFQELDFRTIIDLSALRRSIFAHAIAPTVIAIAERPLSQTGAASIDRQRRSILHVAPHVRPLSAAVDALVITPEEVRTVSAREAIGRPDIWKVLLWGSVRDLELIDHLRSSFPSLGDLAEEHEWVIGQGYKDAPRLSQADATHLHGFDLIEARSVQALRLHPAPSSTFQRPTLHRPRTADRYKGPLVLIPRTLPGGRLSAAFYARDAVYPSGITGISGKAADAPLLRAVAATMVSSLGQYWHFMTSSSWGVERDSVETSELREMPIAIPGSDEAYRLERLLDSGADLESMMPELDDLVFDAYKLDESERQRVRQGVAGGVERFRRSGRGGSLVDADGIGLYCSTLEDQLALSLPDLGISTSHAGEGSYLLVAINFSPSANGGEIVEAAPVDWENFSRRLSPAARTTAVVAQPAGLFVDGDSVYVIKTRDADRWSFNAALDDADRVFSAVAFGA